MHHPQVVFLFISFYFLHIDWWTTLCVCLRFFPLTTVKFCRGFADSLWFYFCQQVIQWVPIKQCVKSLFDWEKIKGWACWLIKMSQFDFEENTLFAYHIFSGISATVNNWAIVHSLNYWVFFLFFFNYIVSQHWAELLYVCKTMYACVYVWSDHSRFLQWVTGYFLQQFTCCLLLYDLKTKVFYENS